MAHGAQEGHSERCKKGCQQWRLSSATLKETERVEVKIKYETDATKAKVTRLRKGMNIHKVFV